MLHLRRPIRAAVALLTLAVLTGCTPAGDGPTTSVTRSSTSASTAATTAAAAAPLVPAEGAYLGIYYGDRTPADTDAAIGRTPQVHLTYFPWEEEWATSSAVRQDAADGRISLVNWEPFDIDLADVVAGRYDAMLTERARQAAELEHPVFLDLAAEMNEEEGWGDHDPALYVAAYRHVHDVFTRHDAGKVVWVWAPNNVDIEDGPPALEYYPGDDYVDWTGIDGYNWGTSQEGFEWESFSEVFAPMYTQLATTGKPMIIAETASAEEGGDKGAWVDGVVPALEQEFPLVRTVVWFDVDKERDWRIGSSAGSAEAFRRAAADPTLQAGVPWSSGG